MRLQRETKAAEGYDEVREDRSNGPRGRSLLWHRARGAGEVPDAGRGASNGNDVAWVLLGCSDGHFLVLQRGQPLGASSKYRAGSRPPTPPSTGHQARLRTSSLWVTSRKHGLLNLGCSEVSRAPRRAREAKLDGRVDGALGKRLGKGGRGAKLPEEDASLG